METGSLKELPSFDKYEVIEVHRSQLVHAEYNPRTMRDEARAKLKRSIERHGMLQPPIWNALSKNIVGGNQRVHILDSLYKSKDYSLKVCRVEMDEVQEKEANVVLNNYYAQGDWDLNKLKELMGTEGLDVMNTGFTDTDVFRLLGEEPFTQRADSTMLDELATRCREMQNHYDDLKKSTKKEDNAEFYMVMVFKSMDERDDFCDLIGWDYNRYQNGSYLMGLLGEHGIDGSAKRSVDDDATAGDGRQVQGDSTEVHGGENGSSDQGVEGPGISGS